MEKEPVKSAKQMLHPYWPHPTDSLLVAADQTAKISLKLALL